MKFRSKEIPFLYNKSTFVLRMACVSIVMSLAACSDEKQTSPTTSDQTPKQQSQTKELLGSAPGAAVGPLKSGYKVIDSFNVGQNIYVRSMTMDPVAKTLWIGTSVGVLEIDIQTRNMLNSFTRDHGLANEYVFGMMVDAEGKKWFGTNGGGITNYKDGKWETYFPMHGLADYWVYSFAQQSTGTIWVGTWAGLNEFDPKTEKFKTYVKELVNEWVYGLDVDNKDRVWIGTEGGVNMFDGKTWSTWTHKDGLGAPNSDNLPASTNTGLGTRSRHDLNVMSQGMNTYNPNYVFSLIVAKDQSVWVGTWGGGVSHYDGNKWTNFTIKEGLAGNIVYSVAQDDNGDLWFGTNKGLSHYDGKSWETITQAHGLLDNSIYAIVSVGNNQVWVGSRNGVALISK